MSYVFTMKAFLKIYSVFSNNMIYSPILIFTRDISYNQLYQKVANKVTILTITLLII